MPDSRVPDPIQQAMREGDKAYAEQEWNKALDAYQRVLSHHPDDAKARRRAIRGALGAGLPGRAAALAEQGLSTPPDPVQLQRLIEAHLAGLRDALRRLRKVATPDRAARRRIQRLVAALDAYEHGAHAKSRPTHKRNKRKHSKPSPRSVKKNGDSGPGSGKEKVRKAPGSLPPYPNWLNTAPAGHHTIQLTTALGKAQIRDYIRRNHLPRKPLYLATYRLNGIAHYILLYGHFENLEQAKKASEKLPLSIKNLWIRPVRSLRAFLHIADWP